MTNSTTLDQCVQDIGQALGEIVRATAESQRVDGRIIGTGEDDFTRGNTSYTMAGSGGKTFRMIDVPGIEGDESQFESLVREAVAQSHLVFYVNGTNKKPEKKTSEKINTYLGRGSKVFAICNVRGMPDAYEFQEDRLSISESHRGAVGALSQTLEVLEGSLAPRALIGGANVQGLLAFCGLAHANNRTTIHPSRHKDLVKTQNGYLKWFDTRNELVEFSEIQAIVDLIQSREHTYRDDIVEANKDKIRELLHSNVQALKGTLKDYHVFRERLAPEFDKCRRAVRESLDSFETLVGSGRKNRWNNFFTTLTERADDIVDAKFGDNDAIEADIKKVAKAEQKELGKAFQKDVQGFVSELEEKISQALTRLYEDMQRVEYQATLDMDLFAKELDYRGNDLSMGLGFKDLGRIGLNLATYTTSGFVVGSMFPGIGNLIGAAVGAVVGTLVSILQVFMSKARKVRKAQAGVRSSIDELRRKVAKKHREEVSEIINPIREHVDSAVVKRVNGLEQSFEQAEKLIESQLVIMTGLHERIEDMPYGTIQKI